MLPSPLKGKYLVQNPWANFILRTVDFFLSKLFRKNPPPIPPSPKSILIANLAHMGDVLLMTSILPVLRKSYPHARIGALIGSWSLPILKNHPDVDQIHLIDHWKLNRSPLSRFKKLRHYYKTKRSAIREIKAAQYAIAIDAYYYFPNAIPLLWQADIPIRIGYTSGGFGPLLTHAFDWKNLNQSVIQYYLPFLNVLKLDPAPFLKPSLSIPDSTSATHIVIHVGTGSSLKEWPLAKWQGLIKKLQGHSLLFTGKGANERETIEKIIDGIEGCTNLADRLSWEEYLAVIQSAKLLIGMDSLAGHLAAVMDTPSVLIYSGMANIDHFAPQSHRCKILSHPVPCAPCYRSRGCASMACVREVSVDDVYATCMDALKEKHPSVSMH